MSAQLRKGAQIYKKYSDLIGQFLSRDILVDIMLMSEEGYLLKIEIKVPTANRSQLRSQVS